MSTINMVFVGIAFVLLLAPFAFYRFTQLENPVETYESGFMGKTGLILFLLCLPIHFAICSYFSGFFYLMSYPREEILEMNARQWGDFMRGDAPPYLGIAAVVGMLLFASGTIWASVTATRRWEAKVWEEPGSVTSKGIRAISYFMNVYFTPLVLAAGIALLWYLFREQFMRNLAAIPYWFRQFVNQNVGEGEQSFLIGFAILGGIPLLFVLWMLVCSVRALATSFWTKTEGTITRSRYHTYVSGTGRNRSRHHRFQVEYNYLVDGIDYAGSNLSYATQWIYHNKPYIWRQTKRYPVGAQVAVYANPNNPEEAVLQAGIDWWGSLVIALHAAFFFLAATTFLIPEIIR